ncbi:hypothetical protein, partial [Klebsiella pneumoniae]|uniref:hypothetical protein n=1 Tax=Klebsiella pneumoniae TaxID=573 RepID=UPI00254B71FC
WLSGGKIGTIEESFIARLRRGDCFLFGGRMLEFVRVQDMAAYVRKPEHRRARAAMLELLELLEAVDRGQYLDPELQGARPMLET